jgi:hypothetical protein
MKRITINIDIPTQAFEAKVLAWSGAHFCAAHTAEAAIQLQQFSARQLVKAQADLERMRQEQTESEQATAEPRLIQE